MPTPDEIVQELMARGVPAEEIGKINPTLGQRAQTGLIAPRLQAPDKIAERGAYIRDYGQINSAREALGRAYPVGAELDRFHSLNTKQPTGGWRGLPVVKDVVEKFDPEFGELSGIASTLQGKARPVGSGATSDFEQRLYRMGVPAPEKQGPVNDSIIAYQKGTMAEESDRLAFQEEFLRRNGSLSGSQQAWGRYVAANPYTVTGEGGRSALNPRRVDWKQHFGLAPAAPQTPAAPTKPKGFSQQLPAPQRNAAKMFLGTKATSGSKGNPLVPASAAEFKNMPSGAWYIDDDGKVYQKGAR